MGYRQHRTRRRRATIGALAACMVLGVGVAGADTGVTLDPSVNDFTLEEGETWSEEIEVTIPVDTATPLVDIYFLADTTGSMGGPISAVKAGANVIIDDLIAALPDSDLNFGVGDFKDFPSDPYAFRHTVSLTSDTDAVKGGINGWGASGGNDTPEGQFYAYDQLASNRAPSHDGSPARTIGWRSGAARILVVFADAPAHDPVCSEITAVVDGHEIDYDITETSVTAKLVSAGITFVGVSTTTGGGMDSSPGGAGNYSAACGTVTTGTAGQATRIAEATGGVHQLGIDNDQIVSVIADEVLAAARTINSLTMTATGETAPFVTAIGPASYGPFDTSEERRFIFTVDWEGVAAATEADQVFTGTLDVVADGSVVASKDVIITVPGVEVLPVVEEPPVGEPPAPRVVVAEEPTEVLPAAPIAVPVTAKPTFTG